MVLENKKSQAILGLMMFFACIILVLALVGTLKVEIDRARNVSNLDCTNTSISTFNSLACVGVDLTLPIWFLTVLFAAAAYFAYRFYKGAG